MGDRERVSYMTKEQLEHYLRDLRTNRPARLGGSRPLAPSVYQQKKLAVEAEAARQRANTIGESVPSDIQQPKYTPVATQDVSTMDRRNSRLGRRDSHRRTRTASSVSFDPVTTEFKTQPAQSGVHVIGIEEEIDNLNLGSSRDNINQASYNASASSPGYGLNRDQSANSFGTAADLRSNESLVSASSTRSRPIMPPYHPPSASAAKKLEKELQGHFQSNPSPVPHPVINRSYSNIHGGAVTSNSPKSNVSNINYSPSRWVYNEPNQSPSNNDARYTTNPMPLPSPPPENLEAGDIGSRESRGRPPLPTMKVNRQSEGKDIAVVEVLPHREVTPPFPAPPIPTFIASNPPVPSICLPDGDLPIRERSNAPSITIKAPSISVPSINIQNEKEATSSPPQSYRPLPVPNGRSIPGARAISSLSSAIPGRAGATCICCDGAISGRIVSALGYRFHPGCFRCFHCHTQLEHVDFFPEPESSCNQRAREFGCRVDQLDKRFYCHLDYHEVFSPRCKHCKTPIEGEVVVALGETWHVGHFFCAECGDPFTQSINFVERDKYAWCTGCYTKRYSSKCKKCRKPITDTVVKALGSEWHVECFCCNTVKRAFCCFSGDAKETEEFEGGPVPTRVRTPLQEKSNEEPALYEGRHKDRANNEDHHNAEKPEEKVQENQTNDPRRPSTDSGFAEKAVTSGNHNPVPEKRRLFSRNGSRSGSGMGYGHEKVFPPSRPTSTLPRKQLLRIQKSRSRIGTLTLAPPTAIYHLTSPKSA